MIVKAICPHCSQKIEALKEVAGQTVTCPTCNHDFIFPKAKSKAGFVVVIIVLLSFVAVIELYFKWQENDEMEFHDMLVAGHKADDALKTIISPENNPNESKIGRLKKEAETSMLEACTNAVVGLNRIVEKNIIDYDDDPNKWTGNMTVEYINKVGGINRKELTFNFHAYKDTVFALEDSSLDDDKEKASQGNSSAEYRMGERYLKGDGVILNTNLADIFFLESKADKLKNP